MKKFIPVILIVLFSGCATVDEDYTFIPIPQAPRQDLTNINKLKTGMTYEEVTALMGTEVKIGFQQGEESTESVGAVGFRNPYSIEMVEVNEVQHLVVFYLTQVNESDGEVTDDELTPVIFKDNLMIGKGWGFFRELKNN